MESEKDAKLLKRINKLLLLFHFPAFKYPSKSKFRFYTCPGSLGACSTQPAEEGARMAGWTQAICPHNLLQSVEFSLNGRPPGSWEKSVQQSSTDLKNYI